MDIRRIEQPSLTPFVDIMGGSARWEVDLLDHGQVALVDCMPRLVPSGQTADHAIVQAARVSYGDGTKSKNDDVSLIQYLMSHRHSTPFEMVELKFHCVMPIFVARQWIRHRTANVNEYSARYSVVKDRFYIPDADNIRKQSNSNKQATDSQVDEFTAQQFLDALKKSSEEAYERYVTAITSGVSRELARTLLPVNAYTEWYWKIDLHNLLHFLSLRLDRHAQYEIRVYAEAMYRMLCELVPVTCDAFWNYRMNGMTLSAVEAELISTSNAVDASKFLSGRQLAEFNEKRRKLGL